LIPLFKDEFDVDAPAQQRLQRAVVGMAVDAAELVARYLGPSRTHALGVRRCAVACGYP
jgi:hypothetical protein